MIAIRETATLTDDQFVQLTRLLVAVVDDGASIGFHLPLAELEAADYWRGVLTPHRVLLLAEDGDRIVGTAQLHLESRTNGRHRAEVAKVMVHPDARRRGIARSLLQRLEDVARREARTLLILDTREGDPSNVLYQEFGYIEVGKIPRYVTNEVGEYQATVIYYKLLD